MIQFTRSVAGISRHLHGFVRIRMKSLGSLMLERCVGNRETNKIFDHLNSRLRLGWSYAFL